MLSWTKKKKTAKTKSLGGDDKKTWMEREGKKNEWIFLRRKTGQTVKVLMPAKIKARCWTNQAWAEESNSQNS